MFWLRLRQDRVALVGGIVVVLMVLLGIVGGPIAAAVTGHPNDQAYTRIMWDEFGNPLGPNNDFWFGADVAGRDLFVRTMYGARTSLIIGVAATGIAVLIGLVVGLLAGYFRGWGDTLLSRVGDVMLSLPVLLISVGIAAACNTKKEGCLNGMVQPGLRVVIAVIAIFSWAYIARIVRGYTLSLREREFVEASRALGASHVRIIVHEIVPNLIGPMLVFTTLLIPQVILFEASLSFIGLGVQPDTASWGLLLSQASANGAYDSAWWLMLFPGIFLLVTTLALNLVGDGLRDALDIRADR
jgi:ABC-type dipeptide/oligopeptide/nickel transport system permease subunit